MNLNAKSISFDLLIFVSLKKTYVYRSNSGGVKLTNFFSPKEKFKHYVETKVFGHYFQNKQFVHSIHHVICVDNVKVTKEIN